MLNLFFNHFTGLKLILQPLVVVLQIKLGTTNTEKTRSKYRPFMLCTWFIHIAMPKRFSCFLFATFYHLYSFLFFSLPTRHFNTHLTHHILFPCHPGTPLFPNLLLSSLSHPSLLCCCIPLPSPLSLCSKPCGPPSLPGSSKPAWTRR